MTRSHLLLAESHVMEAHGHAKRWDSAACARSLGEAERAFEAADPMTEPEWLRYFDEAYLAAKIAHCFRDLAQWDHAQRFAHRSLQMDERYVRGKTFNVALLATTYVETDLEHALAVGRQAVELARDVKSERVLRYIAELRQRLASRSDDPKVREFNDLVIEHLGQVSAERETWR